MLNKADYYRVQKIYDNNCCILCSLRSASQRGATWALVFRSGVLANRNTVVWVIRRCTTTTAVPGSSLCRIVEAQRGHLGSRTVLVPVHPSEPSEFKSVEQRIGASSTKRESTLTAHLKLVRLFLPTAMVCPGLERGHFLLLLKHELR